MTLLDDPRLNWNLLDSHRFDPTVLLEQSRRAAAGAAGPETNLVRGEIAPATGIVTVDYAAESSRMTRAAGEALLADGKVALVVLNGGMATRFGGVVKGVVEVYDGQSFIALKCADAHRAGRRFGRVPPVVLMNSFATDAASGEHVTAHDRFGLGAHDLWSFNQSISVRLRPDGTLFVGDDDRPSYYAPGHGDFFESIRATGSLARLREQGVEHLLFANVDNLGATLDPTLLGLHELAGSDMTVELTERRRDASGNWDVGGAPMLVDGRRCVVEGFRIPSGEQARFSDFQTNSFLFRTAALDQPLALVRYPVIKQVCQRPALQFEAIACEASSALRSDGSPALRLGLLRVPRSGPRGRFYPIKTPADLESSRDELRARLDGSLAVE